MAALATAVAPGARLWSAAGEAATVVDVAGQTVTARIDGERLPVVLNLGVWRPALACDYCDQPAQVQLRDGQPDDVLCRRCAHGQFTRAADWVRPIPKRLIKALYAHCQQLI